MTENVKPTTDVKRYYPIGPMAADDYGYYVKYDDYLAAIEDSARAENAWKNAENELRRNGIDGNEIVDALIFGFNMVYTSPAWGGDERSPEGWKQKEAALRKEFSATVKKAITLFMVFLEFAKERLRVKDDCLQVKVKEVAILRTALAAEQERARVAGEALTALKVHVGIPHDTPDDEVADRLLGIAQPYTDIDVDALIFAFNMVYTSPTWGGDERSPEGWKQKEAALRKAFTSTLRAEKDRLISEVNTAHSDIAGHEEEVSRLTAECEEWKKKYRGADAEVEFLRTEMHRHEDLCVDLRSELRTLRRTSVRVDVLLRWMFSAEPWNSPAVNWSILNRVLIARSRRSTRKEGE